MSHLDLHAYCGADSNFIAWWSADKVDGCLGYAVKRRIDGGEPEPLLAYVPFSGSGRVIANQKGQPSTQWPFQRFTWSDFSPAGGKVEYQVVGMVGKPGHLSESDLVSDWVEAEMPNFGDYIPYFNFGTVSSRWFATMAEQYPSEFQNLRKALADKANPQADDDALAAILKLPAAGKNKGGRSIGDELGGKLAARVKQMLADAKKDPKTTIYAALFELSDPDLVNALAALGQRCNLILANGTHEKHRDENEWAAGQLDGKVALHRREISQASIYAHNKFVVFARQDEPVWAWSGSTNWTPHGLYTQSNNGLEIRNADVARAYLEQWNLLLAAGNTTPPPPDPPAQDQYHFEDSGTTISVFFSPHRIGRQTHDEAAHADADPAPARHTARATSTTRSTHARQTSHAHASAASHAMPAHQTKSHAAASDGARSPDLVYASALIRGAKQGILSLMLDPGWQGSLLQSLRATAQANPDLYVRGVVNTDPTIHAHPDDATAVGFLHGKESIPSNYDIVLPAQQRQPGEPIEDYLGRVGIVVVHSKIIVVDPLGAHPVVMTGSHNMGVKAATKNDDNLVVIENDSDLALAYALNIISVFNHFWWRHNMAPAGSKKRAHAKAAEPAGPKSAQDTASWTGLQTTDKWQDKFYADPTEATEAKFWGLVGGSSAAASRHHALHKSR